VRIQISVVNMSYTEVTFVKVNAIFFGMLQYTVIVVLRGLWNWRISFFIFYLLTYGLFNCVFSSSDNMTSYCRMISEYELEKI
jgi:hypothetical protein